jgi:hypothetical protein
MATMNLRDMGVSSICGCFDFILGLGAAAHRLGKPGLIRVSIRVISAAIFEPAASTRGKGRAVTALRKGGQINQIDHPTRQYAN